jgi:hypothetical protein
MDELNHALIVIAEVLWQSSRLLENSLGVLRRAQSLILGLLQIIILEIMFM